jgi:hypothetical protein
MNEPLAQTEDLQNEVQSLRTLLCVSLILIMVFGACMDFFLIKQVSDLRSATSRAENLWKAVDVTKAVYFWNSLNDYARTHADIAPLIASASPFINQTLLNPSYLPRKK